MTGQEPEATHTIRRLLPWPAPEGKTAYLVTDDPGSPLSLLADSVEDTQVQTAREVLTHARKMLRGESGESGGSGEDGKGETITLDEYAFVTCRLAECVHDLLRIADSRGARLGMESVTETPVYSA